MILSLVIQSLASYISNKMPLDWYSKKQAMVETATCGSKFVAACTCVNQIVDLRTTLLYLDVPLRNMSYIFGDNKTVVDSLTLPHAKLHKHHNALSFHRVRKAIAANFIKMHLRKSGTTSSHFSPFMVT
jgi:hypothetical protein